MELNISHQFKKFVRVWKVLKKPSKEEFLTVTKISAIGILVIGVLGFSISLAMQLLIPHS
jgi:protein transport protein SEC61 subunit gamma and related proteins